MKKKFIVTVREVWYYDVAIEAQNEEDAKEKVEEGLGEDEFDAKPDYVLGREQWDVKEVK